MLAAGQFVPRKEMNLSIMLWLSGQHPFMIHHYHMFFKSEKIIYCYHGQLNWNEFTTLPF